MVLCVLLLSNVRWHEIWSEMKLSQSFVSMFYHLPPLLHLLIHGCGGVSGWTRVTFIDMTNTSQQCPSGLTLTSYSKRTCGRTTSTEVTCDSTSFSVAGITYSRVCGRIIGYQYGDGTAFALYNFGVATTIDSPYVGGVSLTHGAQGVRQHIWTFAVGLTEMGQSDHVQYLCPCSTTRTVNVPPFVGNGYFCESGLHTAYDSSYSQFMFYPNDPLWDGQNCRAGSNCCQFNTPPWFTKDLPCKLHKWWHRITSLLYIS